LDVEILSTSLINRHLMKKIQLKSDSKLQLYE